MESKVFASRIDFGRYKVIIRKDSTAYLLDKEDKTDPLGVCDLTDEQIEECFIVFSNLFSQMLRRKDNC
ncbi:MAG TPA: hypothetical protein VNE86_03360 [Nitrososphaerales archaeon]|nr:hypothetical protein [Nitrososphaerales archaeon]